MLINTSIIFVIVFVGFISLGIILSKNNKNYNFKIHFFAAGKADAILINYNNKYIMIDTGEQSLSDEILKYFKNNNIDKLDYLIITHFDKDHVGSASKIIDELDIDNVLSKKNITPETIVNDKEFSVDELNIKIYGPKKVYDKNESNNSSLITSIVYNNNSFLFMGDAQNARIKDFLEEDNNSYDFLKVPYHGRYLKRFDDLIEGRNIKYAVITSSDEEVEDSQTIKTLEDNNIHYYLTRKGQIDILSDGKNIKVNQ